MGDRDRDLTVVDLGAPATSVNNSDTSTVSGDAATVSGDAATNSPASSCTNAVSMEDARRAWLVAVQDALFELGCGVHRLDVSVETRGEMMRQIKQATTSAFEQTKTPWFPSLFCRSHATRQQNEAPVLKTQMQTLCMNSNRADLGLVLEDAYTAYARARVRALLIEADAEAEERATDSGDDATLPPPYSTADELAEVC